MDDPQFSPIGAPLDLTVDKENSDKGSATTSSSSSKGGRAKGQKKRLSEVSLNSKTQTTPLLRPDTAESAQRVNDLMKKKQRRAAPSAPMRKKGGGPVKRSDSFVELLEVQSESASPLNTILDDEGLQLIGGPLPKDLSEINWGLLSASLDDPLPNDPMPDESILLTPEENARLNDGLEILSQVAEERQPLPSDAQNDDSSATTQCAPLLTDSQGAAMCYSQLR